MSSPGPSVRRKIAVDVGDGDDLAPTKVRTMVGAAPVLSAVSLLNGGIGVRALGQPAHPLGSMCVTVIGSFGPDEVYVAPVTWPACRCACASEPSTTRHRRWTVRLSCARRW